MNLPKISIVTPTLNSSKYLEATIKSIVAQNYPNIEYIIIDGGSTDGTIDIIKKYADQIAYWVSEPDSGMYDAINKGFQKSTGDIMAWLNSDDLYHPGALLCVGEIFMNLMDVEWIIGKSCLFNGDGLCVKMNDLQYWSKNRILSGDYKWIQQENVFWKRSLWDRTGAHITTSLRLAGDFELWNRYFNNSQLNSVQTSFGGFRLHGQQLSVIHSKQYENEVQSIIHANERVGKKIRFRKKMFNILNKTGNGKNTFNLILKSIVGIMIKRIDNHPPTIFYDFTKSKWSIIK